MEKTCLQHLDRIDNWKILRTERPEETQLLPWKPFLPIFFINIINFTLIFALVFALIGFASKVGVQELREDLPGAVVLTIGISAAFALYVTNLYRRTWNRRARWLNSKDDQA